MNAEQLLRDLANNIAADNSGTPEDCATRILEEYKRLRDEAAQWAPAIRTVVTHGDLRSLRRGDSFIFKGVTQKVIKRKIWKETIFTPIQCKVLCESGLVLQSMAGDKPNVVRVISFPNSDKS